MSALPSRIKKLIRDSKTPGCGYGFIVATDTGRDYYFTHTDLVDCAYTDLREGADIEFVPVEDGANRKARAVRLLDSQADTVGSPDVQGGVTHTVDTVLDGIRGALDRIDDVDAGEVFEDCVFVVLRLLGIHTLYQYDRASQAGKADGFFIVGNLAVMYDCTLRSDYMNFKQEQIDNYVNKLNNRSQLKIETRRADGGVGSKTLQVSGKNKQVWIITRGETRELQDIDGIKVKEIAVRELIAIADKRLRAFTYEQEDLSGALTLIDRL